ncbi:MAG: DUF3084 domain-containing protein [Armatimonadetes bacterium]|nr:DUF3084 domain-containing protein [Armatimonadota bacterium]
MPVWTAAALGTTVLMGGLIAYAGDLIGRRFGKRRASIFGLRPRHTAALFTSVTGVLISLLTTAVLFLAVEPVRRVIMQGESAIRSNVRLRRENLRLEQDNARERAAVAGAQKERAEAMADRNAAVRARAHAVRELSGVRASLNRARSALASAQEARRRTERELRTAHARVRAERDAAQELAATNEGYRKVNADLETRNADLTRSNDALRQTNSSLSLTNTSYSQENEAVSRQNVTLVRERDQLTSTVGELRSERERLAQETRSLEERYQQLKEGYTTAYGAHKSLWEMFEALRTRRIVVHGGEDMARTVIPAGTPPEGVRDMVSRLLSDAHRAALAKGAAPGERSLAVEIVDKRFSTPTPSGVSTTRVTEQERIDAIVNRLARAPEPTCLLALAVANSVGGEPAGIDLQPLRHHLVYRRGQAIASRKLDATAPADKVFGELVLMLKGLGQGALERGLIPRFDPATGEPQAGSLSAEDVVSLTERVKAYRRRVEVTAYAASDTSAGDSLKLEFRIRPSI